MLSSVAAAVTWSSNWKNGSNISSGNGSTTGSSAYLLDGEASNSPQSATWEISSPWSKDLDCVWTHLEVEYDNDRPWSGANQNPPDIRVMDGSTGGWSQWSTLPSVYNNGNYQTKTIQPLSLGYAHPSNGGSTGPVQGVRVEIKAQSGEYIEVSKLRAGTDIIMGTPPTPTITTPSLMQAYPNWNDFRDFYVTIPGKDSQSCRIEQWNYVITTSSSPPSGHGSVLSNSPWSSSNTISRTIPNFNCQNDYYFHAKYKDEGGRWSDWDSTARFQFDDTSPTNVDLHDPMNGAQWVNNIGTISWDPASDACSGLTNTPYELEYRLGGSGGYTKLNDYSNTNDGGHLSSQLSGTSCSNNGKWGIRLTVHDNAGESTDDQEDLFFDDCAPTQSELDIIIQDSDYWFTTSSPTLTWQTANDCSSSEDCVRGVEYQLTGDVVTTTSSTSYDTSSGTSLDDGVHQVSIITCDSLNNCGSATSSNFRIDTINPEMTQPSSSSISDWSNDPNFWVVLGADDSNPAAVEGEVSGVETIYLKMSHDSTVSKSDTGWVSVSCLNGQGVAESECSSRQVNYDMTSMGSGIAHAFFYASDAAGNELSDSELLPSLTSYKFDFDAPHGDLAPVIDNIGSNGYLDANIAELSWSAASDEQSGIDVSGVVGYAVAVNDIPSTPALDIYHPLTSSDIQGFRDGMNRICVSAIDAAGNNGSWHCTANFEYDAAQFDTDDDGHSDADDNCPTISNPSQSDSDEDGIGDVCEADADYDGIIDDEDNCVNDYNPNQSDFNNDGIGDACSDIDEDGVSDDIDNCREDANTEQLDSDGDGIGDSCDDSDEDGIMDASDNCPYHTNPQQEDQDANGVGDACEGSSADSDSDGVPDSDDNCPSTPNSNQEDTDSDEIGDACDTDSGETGGGGANGQDTNEAPSGVDIKLPLPNSYYSQNELNGVSLEWWSATNDVEVVRYRIQFDEQGWKNIDDLSDLSYPFPLLESDESHRVQIYAVDGDGKAGPTSSVTLFVCEEGIQANSDRTGCMQDVLSDKSSIFDGINSIFWYGLAILILVASFVMYMLLSRGGGSGGGEWDY